MDIDTIFYIVILVLSVVVHEVSHGAMAYYLGDTTAKRAGRLTLNPIPHIDIVGSVILPMIMIASHSPILFGWAKPVPYNPYNLKKGGIYAETLVALAGPVSNFILAIIFGSLIRFHIISGGLSNIIYTIVILNIFLGLFNLIPIPPLDGSKVLPALLSKNLAKKYESLIYSMFANPLLGFLIIIVIISFFDKPLINIVYTLSRIIIGG